MDLSTVFMPGAQSLVTAIMTESWTQARAAVAKLWVRHRNATPSHDPAAIERASHELDAARLQALQLAGTGSESDRAARMQIFWAGYLAGQAAARPELAAAIIELPELLGAAHAPASQTSTVNNSISGTVHGNAVQAGDIHGDITFRR